MKRELKFRGYSVEKSMWVYGSLVNNMWTFSEHSSFLKGSSVFEIITGCYEGDCWEDVVSDENCIVAVHPESVGQFTGLTDKNRKEIYEGDLVNCNRYESGDNFLVKVKDLRCLPTEMFGSNLNYLLVIGNIYDTPELLNQPKV